jgi:phosphatidylinositol-3-phosphatase
MKQLLGSKEYRSGDTAIFVTWTDGTPGTPRGVNCVRTLLASCRIATLVVAPSVKPGTVVATRLTHYSLLRTTEVLLGVPKHLGAARSAAGMRVPFGL